jgi:hypothetical protein
MRVLVVIIGLLFIYQSNRLNTVTSEYSFLLNENKHLKEQLQKANDQVIEWNNNYMAKDYAKRNGLKNLKHY